MVNLTVAMSVLELGFGAGAAIVAYFAWQERSRPAGFPVFALMLTGSIYALINGFESLTANPSISIALGHLRWPFGAIVAIATLYTAVEYTHNHFFRRREVFWPIIGLLVIDVVAFLTNPYHELLLHDPTVEGMLFVAVEGPLLWTHLVFSFALAIIGLLLLIVAFFNRNVHRTQSGAIMLGIAMAIGLFVAETFIVIHPAFNIGTIGIIVGALTIIWAINYAGFLETVPVAREALMDNMNDSIIALDTDLKIIDINEATREFLETDGKIRGEPAAEVFAAYPNLVEKLDGPVGTNEELSIQRNGQLRYYHLSSSPIRSTRGGSTKNAEFLGRLVVLSDITDRHRREEELDLLKQVFARILRHNMRNDLNVIKGNASILEERVDGSDEDIVQTVSNCTNNLLTMSEKARDLETIIESPREREPVQLGRAIDRAISTVKESYPDASITVEMAQEVTVQAHRELETAIKNVIENACEHDDSPPTTVEITVTIEAETVVLTIEDDGPGIPEHELDVLEAETEESLKHGSGLGLWILNWVANRSKANVNLTADDGTRVTLRLDRAEPDNSDDGDTSDPAADPTATPSD